METSASHSKLFSFFPFPSSHSAVARTFFRTNQCAVQRRGHTDSARENAVESSKLDRIQRKKIRHRQHLHTLLPTIQPAVLLNGLGTKRQVQNMDWILHVTSHLNFDYRHCNGSDLKVSRTCERAQEGVNTEEGFASSARCFQQWN